ncbi:MAG: tyrosine-type recombinase/integrase [Planctomycetales bacterium]|nr:tyrosine-type recombinase/integrase [Planctomycetales bacterium]MBN8625676.1 tyrosine-type recombinase/integrase [Planctomycetota bacterium]
MGRTRKKRRASHGSAWHWKQTDSWYYTLPGTKRRMPLFDEQGERIRGLENREAAAQALARVQLSGEGSGPAADPDWIVARVCSEYLQHCERSVISGSMSRGHRDQSIAFLNDLCGYCGALPVAELKKSHLQTWIDQHQGWKSPATHRSVIAIVLAAFNRAEQLHDVPSPLKGLKKPQSQPRLQSFSPEEERQLLEATEVQFRNFLFAAIHTGLRPFCELAKITADDVEVTERGMMWRVYSSKTKKTRKIPVQKPVAELVKKLLPTAPRGSGKPLFRNTKGEPWKRMTGVVRFLALKKKLGWDLDPRRAKYSSYTSRHTFAHRMLSGYWNKGVGCSIETLAELIGDTPAVAYQHYGREWALSYQEPLWAAIGAGSAKNATTQSKRPLSKAR